MTYKVLTQDHVTVTNEGAVTHLTRDPLDPDIDAVCEASDLQLNHWPEVIVYKGAWLQRVSTRTHGDRDAYSVTYRSERGWTLEVFND